MCVCVCVCVGVESRDSRGSSRTQVQGGQCLQSCCHRQTHNMWHIREHDSGENLRITVHKHDCVFSCEYLSYTGIGLGCSYLARQGNINR